MDKLIFSLADQYIFEKYLIFYFPLKDGGIEIIRILHGARDLERMYE